MKFFSATSSSSYITSYCNFYSYILVFPYTITRDETSGKLILSSSKSRKISCIFLHLMVCLAATIYLVGFINSLVSNDSNSFPIYYLGCFFVFCGYLSFFELVWRRSEKLLQIANWFMQKDMPPVSTIKIWILCLIPPFIATIFSPLAKSFLSIFGKSVDDGILPSFYLSSNLASDCSEFSKVFLRTFEYLIAACFLFTHSFFLIGTGMMSALLFSINVAVSSYEKKLKSYNMEKAGRLNRAEMLKTGIIAEADLRQLINLTNSILGSRIVLEYLMLVVFYACVLKLFTASETTLAERAHAVLCAVQSGMFWLSACEVHYQVTNITKKWITKYRNYCTLECQGQEAAERQLEETRLLALQTETDSNPAGISCRCFAITYGFLGSMLGLIITYSALVFQLQSSSATSMELTSSTEL